MQASMNMEYLTQRLQCSSEEKTGCLETVKKLYQYGCTARSGGLLAMEKDLAWEENFFLKKALDLVVDARDPEIIESIMIAYLAAGNHTGGEFLSRVAATEGALLIQSGCNPEFLIDTLGGWFGEEFEPAYKEEMRRFAEQEAKKRDDFKELINSEERRKISHLCEFDELSKIDERALQRIERELEIGDIAVAALGAEERLARRLYDNLSCRMQEIFLSELVYAGDAERAIIEAAQRRILNKMEHLNKTGQIIRMDNGE